MVCVYFVVVSLICSMWHAVKRFDKKYIWFKVIIKKVRDICGVGRKCQDKLT